MNLSIARVRKNCWPQMTDNMHIIQADGAWAERYRLFCQPIYEVAYSAPELGIPAELFSEAEFDDKSTREYFRKMFTHDHVWLMLDAHDAILGGVAASDTDPVHMSGFYVANTRQGQGIGRKLFDKVVEFAGPRDIVLDVMRHRTPSIEVYRHLGFEVDESVPPVYYGWPYPSDVGRQNGAGVTMRRKGNNKG